MAYYCFVNFGWPPSRYDSLPYGEKLLVTRFALKAMDDERKDLEVIRIYLKDEFFEELLDYIEKEDYCGINKLFDIYGCIYRDARFYDGKDAGI